MMLGRAEDYGGVGWHEGGLAPTAIPLLETAILLLGLLWMPVAWIVPAASAVITASRASTAATPNVVVVVLAVPAVAVPVGVVVLAIATVPVVVRPATTAVVWLSSAASMLPAGARAVACHVTLLVAGVAVAVETISRCTIARAGGVQDLQGCRSLQLEFLLGELEPRLSLHEGGERLHGLQNFLLYLEAVIKARDEAHGQLLVGDESADVTELVSVALDLAAVGDEVHVTLGDIGELLVEVDLAPFCVLREEMLEGVPGDVGGAVILEDDVLELIGDGGVDPEDDVDVGGVPLVICEMRIRLLLDVIVGVVLGEGDEEEATPLVVVADRRVELEFDEASDVDAIGGGRGGLELN